MNRPYKSKLMQDVRFGRASYRNDYLKSEEWKTIRERIIRKSEGVCEKCREAPCTDVHHMDYRILKIPGFGTRNELIALCRPCHDLVEDAVKLRLLYSPHNREMLMKVTKDEVTREKRRLKAPASWDADMTAAAEKASFQACRRVCGLLKLPYPRSWKEWEGMRLSVRRKEKITWMLKSIQVADKHYGSTAMEKHIDHRYQLRKHGRM